MKKIIVTTTINEPTEAILKFDSFEDWQLLVIADQETPGCYDHHLKRGSVMYPEQYEKEYAGLVELIGFNSVRLGRMIGFIEAYRRGADIIASVDDDIMPFDDWGQGVVLGEEIEATEWDCPEICFDPFRPYSYTNLAHRGVPLELGNGNQYVMKSGGAKIIPLVREDICLGQSDYNAIDRLSGSVDYFEMDTNRPYFADCFSPINTQNTFIHRSVIKDFYANIPFIGRADDIWAGYIFQALHPRSTIYGYPSAVHEQERSVQSIVNDLEEEIFMYRNTMPFLMDLRIALTTLDCRFPVDRVLQRYLPPQSIEAIKLYRSYFND